MPNDLFLKIFYSAVLQEKLKHIVGLVVRNAAFMSQDIAIGVIWDTEVMWPLCVCIIKLGRTLLIPSMTGCRILLFPRVVHVKLYIASHRYYVSLHRVRTSQYGRIFVHRCSHLWNGLDSGVFDDGGLVGFKSQVNRFLLVTCLVFYIFFYLFNFGH